MTRLLLLILLGLHNIAIAQESPFSVAEQCVMTKKTSLERRTDAAYLNIVNQSFNFSPNPANGYLNASSKIIFTPKTNTSKVIFELEKSLHVDSVRKQGNTIAFSRQLDLIVLNYSPLLLAGTLDTLEIFYQGQPSFNQMYYSRSVHKSGNIIATRSQPYGCYYWFPCQNTLNDKIDSIEITIVCDSIYTGVSNGVLVETGKADSVRNYYHWKHSYPIAPYLICMSVSPYEIITDYASVNNGNDSVKIQNFVYPFYTETAKTQVKQTIPIMTLYDSLFGAYPFMREQYGHTQFHHGGGMEHQTMSFMGSFSFDLIAHELMHQWFGDKLTCSSWQDLWLNEGFATYGNMLCYQFLRNDSLWKLQLQTAIDQVLSKPNGSVFAFDTASTNTLFDQRLVYFKGAMVVHMLRFVCGDSAFFSGLRSYLADTDLAYGFVNRNHLQWHLEQSSGKDLSTFFDQWVMRQGFPIFTIHYQQHSNKTVKLSIFQETSDPSVNFFETPIPLLLKGKNGEKEMITVLPKANNDNIKFQVLFDIEAIEFDPEKWILARAIMIKDKGTSTSSLLLYPNPSNDLLNVVSFDHEIQSYQIMSLDGKVVAEYTFTTPLAIGEISQINLEQIQSGLYIFESTSSAGKQIRKFVKQ
ncbi:MAG: T9SS type A sorting domain-containing protein [Bacteroidia bacterium]|nr:T9SS type A sorting domain-containing protein [Bacteroidia bacterium]